MESILRMNDLINQGEGITSRPLFENSSINALIDDIFKNKYTVE